MAVEIYQEIELSLTESLIPTVLHVKQFDHNSRRIRCIVYEDGMEYTIPDGVIISCTGTRPDGLLFQYSSESSPEHVFIEDNRIIFTVTDFMTEKFGRYPIDLLILSGDGDVIGMFTLVLRVERAAVRNHRIAVATYANVADALGDGMENVDVNEDGCLVFTTDDMDMAEGSVSATLEMVKANLMEDSTLVGENQLRVAYESRLDLEFWQDDAGVLYARSTNADEQ